MGRGSKFIAIILITLLGLVSSGIAQIQSAYAPGQILVSFVQKDYAVSGLSRPMSSIAIKNMVVSIVLSGAKVTREYNFDKGLALVRLPSGVSVNSALTTFASSSAVRFAEPDYYRKLQAIPNDVMFSSQWALDNIGQADGLPGADIDAVRAWDIEPNASSIVVAVIDTGLDVNHPDINDNVGINVAEFLGRDANDPNKYDTIDNDGYGFVNDIKGWDFAGADINDLGDADNDVADKMGHGTHVAGIIGAVGNNSRGISGVAQRVMLWPIKVFADNSEYATTSDVVAGIDYAVAFDVNVINLSLGSYAYSITEYSALKRAQAKGVLVVAAAGNDGYDNDSEPMYPAAYDLDNIISVMATNNDDWPSYYSNYGNRCVDIAAPGGDMRYYTDGGILSTLPGDNYGYLQGTSMAAPHVAGAAALVMQMNLGLDCNSVKTILLNSADKLPSLSGLCVSGGRLNLYNAVYRSRPGVVGRWTSGIKAGLYSSIQDAIDAATTGDVIIAQYDRYYYENIDFKGLDLTVRSGDPNDDANNTVYPLNTTISGAFDLTEPTVLINKGETSSADLVGFSISDSFVGVYVDNSSPQIEYCYVQDNNNTSSSGGGIILENGANSYIHDCKITGNFAKLYGGGIYINNSSPVIEESTISGNGVTNGMGGGIYGYNTTCDLHFVDILNNNSSGYGGGVYFESATLNINDSNFIGNATNDHGAGMYLYSTTATITDCNISSNTSHFDGGGVYWDTSSGSISGTVIADNVSDYSGGGMYLLDSSPSIFNCLIVRNDCIGGNGASGGAGLFLNGSQSVISSCTIADNTVESQDRFGGGIYLYYKTTAPTIVDCIFSGNSKYAIYEGAYTENGVTTFANPASVSYSLFGENLPKDYYNAEDGQAYDANSIGTYNINELGEVSDCIGEDPIFAMGRLGNYYLSQTAAGQVVDSPAVNAGSATAAALMLDTLTTRTDNGVDTDQVDIGFHYKDTTVIGTVTLTVTRIPTTGGTVTQNPLPGAGGTYKMYSQVRLTAIPTGTYQLASWSGTDNDASDANDNIVTMLSSKVVVVTFESRMIELRVIIDTLGDANVATSSFTVNPNYDDPRRNAYLRGTIVHITVDPGNASYRIEWSGTGDNSQSNDGSNELTNWVKMDAPTGQREVVCITFVKPRVLDVPGDYIHIQDALDAAKNKDTVVIAPGTYDISESSNDDFHLTISGKDITVTSRNPNDPCVVASTVIKQNYHVTYGAAPVLDATARNYGLVYVTDTPLYGMMEVSNVSRNMLITGITFQSNVSASMEVPTADVTNDGRNGFPLDGGAIALVQNASPTILNCVFDGCKIQAAHGLPGRVAPGNGGWGGWAHGGALYCGSGSDPLVRYCSFLNCSAKGGDGGNGTELPTAGHGGSWETYSENSIGWYWGPYLPYWKYSGYGGAVYVETGSAAVFENCVFKNNNAMGGSCGLSGGVAGWPQQHFQIDAYGGAVYCAQNSSPTFTRCQFIDNQLDPNGVGGTHYDSKTPIAVVVDKLNNPYTWGGAIGIEDNATPRFKNCTFTNNASGGGGAIYADYADPLVSDSTFTKNTAMDGGAMYLVNGNCRIARSTLTYNAANGSSSIGGAIVASDANLWLCDSKVQYNTSKGSGGGLYIFGDNTSWLMNCLITNNTAVRDGGGVTAAWYAEPNFMNCTIANNKVTGTAAKVSFGGGINLSYHADANVANCIIYGNTATNGPQIALTDDFIDSETGDVYYNLPSYVRVKYTDIQGLATPIYKDSGCKVIWGSGNFDLDPKFVSGYYLSQTASGQTVNSPCVNKGTSTLSALHFIRHTTRTDLVLDSGVPDLGFHYIKNYDLVGDYNFDGVVNITDLNLWAFNVWLNRDCEFPYWCNGRDLNEDGIVDYTDVSTLKNNYGKTETTKPTPNPMKFSSAPRRNTSTTATMTAAQAVDNSAGLVYYQFQRLSASGAETSTKTGWTTSRTWTDKALSTRTVYGYRVRARDKNNNCTNWSSPAYITNAINNDTTKPTPNPSTWAKKPYAVSGTSVSMTATTAKDVSGVEYYFDETTGRSGGTDSGWISSPTYTDTGLTPNATYAYRVRVRDRSAAKNTTTFSTTASVKVVGVPSPNPPIWEVEPDETSTTNSSGLKTFIHSMTVGECTSASGTVEYFFECVAGNGLSSSWQTSRTYSYAIGNRSVPAAYRVRARVKGTTVTTSPSTIRYAN